MQTAIDWHRLEGTSTVDKETLKRFVYANYDLVDIVTRKPNTMIKVTVWHHGKMYNGFGFSKCCYPDTFNRVTGIHIATGKAIAHCIEQILKP